MRRALIILTCVATMTVAADEIEPTTIEIGGIELVRIPSGEFMMGSPDGEAGREEQEVAHRVVIAEPFLMGRYEVTQAQWIAIMGNNPSNFGDCLECPVERVNFFDVERFIAALNEKTERTFRLPTEAEWEYACRAGTTTPFHFGETITADLANFDARYPHGGAEPGIYRERTTKVGSFPPNAWGLYDMHGNVWEWTSTWHCPYAADWVTDPDPECDTELRVIRGGSWYFDGNSSRCALRYTHRPRDLGFSIGFRLVAEIE